MQVYILNIMCSLSNTNLFKKNKFLAQNTETKTKICETAFAK